MKGKRTKEGILKGISLFFALFLVLAVCISNMGATVPDSAEAKDIISLRTDDDDDWDDDSGDDDWDDDWEDDDDWEFHLPEKPVLVSVKNQKSKSAQVTWKKANYAEYYEISCKLKTGKKAAKYIVSGNTTSYKIKKLKKGKTYCISVRGCAYNEEGDWYYGSWSAVKKVKIKK